MPKKFAGENSKAVAARARKSTTKEADVTKKQKEAEEAYWQDDDKHVAKKLQRKQDSEQKKQQALQKKLEAKAMLEAEMGSISVAAKQPAAKLTRAQIQAETERRNAAAAQAASKTSKPKTHVEQPLQENINRLQPEEIANTVDEAIRMLSVSDTNTVDDLHPEKRLKSAYMAYEENNLPRLKQENPSLRLTQLKQMLFKEWSKSSENPLNKGK